VLDGGTIVAYGTRDEILTDEALLHAHGLELPWAIRNTRP
jgi:ABC-type cobalamin transport system ATPase subunit